MPACDGKLFTKLKTGDVFIETGTYVGQGVNAALVAGFKTIHSVELSPVCHEQAAAKFVGNERVNLILGDSRNHLGRLAKQYKDEDPMFWLDAHFSGGDTAKVMPLLEMMETELDILLEELGQGHSFSVLIDDLPGEALFKMGKEWMTSRWPTMTVSHEDGCHGAGKLMPKFIVAGRLRR